MVTARRGFTLTEALLVVAIMGILSVIGPRLLIQTDRFMVMSRTRADLQKEARAIMYVVNRQLRQAQANTIRIDQATNQPYYSRITFTKQQGTSVSFYQNGKYFQQTVGTNTKILSKNLRYLAFTFPRSDDLTIVSVSMTLEASIYEARTKALHMASERVRIMN
jgi:prepilin-type N-terminal cleavage/methylation domain-containing protein